MQMILSLLRPLGAFALSSVLALAPACAQDSANGTQTEWKRITIAHALSFLRNYGDRIPIALNSGDRMGGPRLLMTDKSSAS